MSEPGAKKGNPSLLSHYHAAKKGSAAGGPWGTAAALGASLLRDSRIRKMVLIPVGLTAVVLVGGAFLLLVSMSTSPQSSEDFAIEQAIVEGLPEVLAADPVVRIQIETAIKKNVPWQLLYGASNVATRSGGVNPYSEEFVLEDRTPKLRPEIAGGGAGIYLLTPDASLSAGEAQNVRTASEAYAEWLIGKVASVDEEILTAVLEKSAEQMQGSELTSEARRDIRSAILSPVLIPGTEEVWRAILSRDPPVDLGSMVQSTGTAGGGFGQVGSGSRVGNQSECPSILSPQFGRIDSANTQLIAQTLWNVMWCAASNRGLNVALPKYGSNANYDISSFPSLAEQLAAEALVVASCESGFLPENLNSDNRWGYGGLMQFGDSQIKEFGYIDSGDRLSMKTNHHNNAVATANLFFARSEDRWEGWGSWAPVNTDFGGANVAVKLPVLGRFSSTRSGFTGQHTDAQLPEWAKDPFRYKVPVGLCLGKQPGQSWPASELLVAQVAKDTDPATSQDVENASSLGVARVPASFDAIVVADDGYQWPPSARITAVQVGFKEDLGSGTGGEEISAEEYANRILAGPQQAKNPETIMIDILIEDGFPPPLANAIVAGAGTAKRLEPSCALQADLLAAVVFIETLLFWERIQSDGILSPPILGDTVGLFQVSVSDWNAGGVDGNRDGSKDVQQVFDSVAYMAQQLCVNGDNLADEDSIAKTLWGRNRSTSYRSKVLAVRDRYRDALAAASYDSAAYIGSGNVVDIESGSSVPESATRKLVLNNGCTSLTSHVAVAAQAEAMINAAFDDGVYLCGWGWRSIETQVRLRNKNCSVPAIYSTCRPPTATPGKSQHERGLAFDFTTRSGSTIKSRSQSEFIWLQANAGKYGLKNFPKEPWHWSTSGR